ncbi:MAG: cytochrome b/b6 domain-containing protein, partial [Sedimenticolaceae bacterium]
PTRYIGHNPIGGWMVIALMASLTATGVTGVMMGAEDGLWEEFHEIAAYLSLLLVAVHVGGVLVASLLHEENLIGAMLTGKKLRRNPDV